MYFLGFGVHNLGFGIGLLWASSSIFRFGFGNDRFGFSLYFNLVLSMIPVKPSIIGWVAGESEHNLHYSFTL